jgi:hypothetical protein
VEEQVNSGEVCALYPLKILWDFGVVCLNSPAITAFTEQAKTELAEYLDRKTIEVSSKTVEEQRAAIQEAARVAFRYEASDKAANLGLVLGEAAKEFRRSMWSRLMEHAITALISSGFTVGLFYALVKIH